MAFGWWVRCSYALSTAQCAIDHPADGGVLAQDRRAAVKQRRAWVGDDVVEARLTRISLDRVKSGLAVRIGQRGLHQCQSAPDYTNGSWL